MAEPRKIQNSDSRRFWSTIVIWNSEIRNIPKKILPHMALGVNLLKMTLMKKKWSSCSRITQIMHTCRLHFCRDKDRPNVGCWVQCMEQSKKKKRKKMNVVHGQHWTCIYKNMFYLCLLTIGVWFIDWLFATIVSCICLQLTFYIGFIWVKELEIKKKKSRFWSWFVGNLDYRKTSSLPGCVTDTIFTFLCLNVKDLFKIV